MECATRMIEPRVDETSAEQASQENARHQLKKLLSHELVAHHLNTNSRDVILCAKALIYMRMG